MARKVQNLTAVDDSPAKASTVTAVVNAISDDGLASVLVFGRSDSCLAGSLIRFSSVENAREQLVGRTVLVRLDQSEFPIILGVITESVLDEELADGDALLRLPQNQDISLRIDKQVVELSAEEEIKLTCGKSTLLLRRNGTIVLRGVKISSRASQSNKIKGGSVNIN